MENFPMYDLTSWVLENEEDFSLGAKATPFLPPATGLDIASQNVEFELPEWMECREILGLEEAQVFEDPDPSLFNHIGKIEEACIENDPNPPIKPEDMLVPLSELQPPKTPKQIVATPALNTIEHIPKVILCKKIVKKNGNVYEIKYDKVQNVETLPASTIASQNFQPDTSFGLLEAQNVEALSASTIASQNFQPDTSTGLLEQDVIPITIGSSTDNSKLDSELSDMMQMIGENSGDVSYESIPQVNSEILELHMEDLLSQLNSPDASDTSIELSDTSSWGSEPASPVSLPSPVPSLVCLSPDQTSSESFLSTSVNEEYNDLGAHSYSRSPLKNKRSKTSARRVPYPQDRKERKKEQNKQAALRYRQKKKQEDDDIMNKIKLEEKRQEELTTKYKGLKQELGYLKKLMREVFVAKGVVSADAFKKKK